MGATLARSPWPTGLPTKKRRGGATCILGVQSQPLAGKRIVVTRPVEQADNLITALARAGAVPIHVPAIRFEAIGDSSRIVDVFAKIDSFDWIVFTSAKGVRFFRELCGEWSRIRIAAVGPATAAALRDAGVEVDFVPDEFVGEALARTLGDVAGRRILLPRAETASADIVDLLRARGAYVEDLPIYRTLSAGSSELHAIDFETGVDCILFASGSAVRSIAEATMHTSELKKVPVVCIGPVTADTARGLGFDVVAVAHVHTTPGLIDALTAFFRRKELHP